MTKSYRIRGIDQSSEAGQVASPMPKVAEIGLEPLRRLLPGTARDAGASEFEAAADEVVRIEYANGFVLWCRADDLIREHARRPSDRGAGEVWEIEVRPPHLEGMGSTRGWLGIGIKVLEFFGVKIQEKAAAALGKALEEKQLGVDGPGLYRCSLEAEFKLTEIPATEALPSGDQPMLLFIHGTASSCRGSFGKLWEVDPAATGDVRQQALAELRERYAERAYAWEHRSLSQSPIENALELVRRLPQGAHIHLVTHSRGGLVGELLCLAQRDRQKDPLQETLLEELFKADRTMAEQLGLGPLDSAAKEARNYAYAQDRQRLIELLDELTEKNLSIDRFVRVACPARGTTLASGRLDRWLSVVDFVSGNGLFGDVADFLLAVVKERTDPRTLPGLEAMMPGSALIRLLHLPDLRTQADLSVIAGDIEGEDLFGRFKLLLTDWFYGADHDLVVNTGSMYGGIRRPEDGARFRLDQGEEVSHFHYFTNDQSVRWLLAGLTRAAGSDGGFQPMQAAKQQAPKWREALRRSRARTAPQPLAVVLPGTMGSALNAQGLDVWLDYWELLRGGLKRLRIRADGVKATDLLDDFYAPLLEFLSSSHRVEIFPYDWRLSVRDTAEILADRLEDWLPELERQTQPLHLVAHSMGGLVVRAMLAGPRGKAIWRRIKALPNSRFMMLGTPNQGSHEAMRWLTGQNPTELKLSLLDFTQGTRQIIDIVRRYPGLLELLPWSDADPDFSRHGLWEELRDALRADWKPADAESLQDARETWSLLKSSPLDPDRMVYVAGHQRATVTDYALFDDQDDPLNFVRQGLDFIATRQGDGTVTWKSGILPGVKTWYVEDTAHDELCTQARAFPGYLDLLLTGNTRRLHQTPPAQARAAGETERFSMPRTPFSDDLPDLRSVRHLSFGPGRPRRMQAERPALPRIRVSITHGNLAYARHHVLVGHYQGDTIVSAEAALDARLDGALTDRLKLGIYPGPLNTHALFFNQRPGANPKGALVIGLGQVGELTPGLLESGVRSALLDFALQKLQRSHSEQPDRPQGVVSVTLTCMLVGSGAGGMSLRDSVDAILRAAVAANEKLLDAGLGNQVLIDVIQFLELYEDLAIQAAKALRETLSDGQLSSVVEWSDPVIQGGQGGRSRVGCDESPDWWHRLEIIEDKGRDGLRFIATTDRARAEVTQGTGQLLLADAFIQRAIRSPAVNADLTKTLFEILLPNRLKEMAPRQTDLVLLVDTTSARYPWELLEDRWSYTSRPPAVAAGMVRQLKTQTYRPTPAHAFEAKVLVVGNPDLEGWREFPDLPGARREAQQVADVLAREGFSVKANIDGKADKIIDDLHSDAWRILHLAGHGAHEFTITHAVKDEEQARCLDCGQTLPLRKETVSGMVIGDHAFLTPGDVEQMRWVPELVFINCCHLGRTQSSRPVDFNRLAANLAVEFIHMGVKAVVAAGWAVDDDAALAFAESFYRHMLEGSSFGEAVRSAREAIWVRHQNVNTWGAYQCYGDPSFTLRSDGERDQQRDDVPFHSPVELVAELRNLSESIRMQSSVTEEDEDPLETFRRRVRNLEGRIPANQRAEWQKLGNVAAAYARAWGEVGAYAEAIDWFERAALAEKADLSVRSMEQYANFRVRHAAEVWQGLAAEKESAATAEQRALIEPRRRELIERIEQAVEVLEFLTRQGKTAERLNLLGGAYKRLALLQEAAKDRRETLEKMADYYHQSFDMGNKSSYAFINWALAQVLNPRTGAKAKTEWQKQQLELTQECHRMLEIVRRRDDEDPDFWNSVAGSDLELVLLLVQSGLTSAQIDVRTRQIIEGYRAARRRGASPREMASVRENLDFIIAMCHRTKYRKELWDGLAVVRAAI